MVDQMGHMVSVVRGLAAENKQFKDELKKQQDEVGRTSKNSVVADYNNSVNSKYSDVVTAQTLFIPGNVNTGNVNSHEQDTPADDHYGAAPNYVDHDAAHNDTRETLVEHVGADADASGNGGNGGDLANQLLLNEGTTGSSSKDGAVFDNMTSKSSDNVSRY